MGITNRFTSEEYVEEKLADLEASLSPIQSDWNQNDEISPDYIKNRPFYSTGEYESKELLKDFKPTALGDGTFMLRTCPVLIEGQTYQVILNNEEFICVGRIDNEGSVSLGNINYKTDGWTDEYEPFSLSSLGGMGILDVNPATASTEYTISISEATEKIQLLDKKYIADYLVGEKTEGKELVYEDKTYIGGVGSEIFNSPVNKAIGSYSHAEGADTVALGDNSHAEGLFTKALADDSHAEGSGTYTEGNSSHAEGYYTQTFGMGSHSEGIHTIASGDYSHAEGENTVANSQSSHVQGRFNVLDSLPKYTYSYFISNIQYNGEENVYILNNTPILNAEVGTFDAEITETQVKNLKTNDLVIFSNQKPFNTYYNITEVQSDDNSQYQLALTGITTQINRGPGTYAHIVGNGTSEEKRSNAHTLDWNGNAWYQGDVYVGSNSGVNRDKGSKKLATEDFVSEKFNQLSQKKADYSYVDEKLTNVKVDLTGYAKEDYVDDEIEELNKKIVQETGKLSQENAELKGDLANISEIEYMSVVEGKTLGGDGLLYDDSRYSVLKYNIQNARRVYISTTENVSRIGIHDIFEKIFRSYTSFEQNYYIDVTGGDKYLKICILSSDKDKIKCYLDCSKYIETNNDIYATDICWKTGYINTIGVQTPISGGFMYSDIISLEEYKLEDIDIDSGTDNILYVSFYDKSGDFISGLKKGRITEVSIPTNAMYIRFTVELSSKFYVHFTQREKQLSDLKNDTFNNNSIVNYLNEKKYLKLFKKIGGIGDSLMSGEYAYKKSDGEMFYKDVKSHSWLSNIGRNNSIEVVHYSYGGLTCKTWLENLKTKLVNEEQKCNAYFIGLGTNDSLQQDYPIGNPEDAASTTTFCGLYKEIIETVKQSAPEAVIFCVSLYNTSHSDYNNAIKSISNLYNSCYYIDFASKSKLLLSGSSVYVSCGHFTALGYIEVAQNIENIVADVINQNLDDFKFFGINDVSTD